MFYFEKLEWDSSFFNYPSYKLKFNTELTVDELKYLEKILTQQGFYTIQRQCGIQKNIDWLSTKTKAVLVDVNIQFLNKINYKIDYYLDDNINIKNNFKYNEDIILFMKKSFKYSRFLNDRNIVKEKSLDVYVSWMKNAFLKNNKYFAIYKIKDRVVGVILFSIDKNNNSIILELVCVNENYQSIGIGSKIMYSIFNYAQLNNIKQVRVGTQLNNINAINFYIKNGFLVDDIYYTFHLWI